MTGTYSLARIYFQNQLTRNKEAEKSLGVRFVENSRMDVKFLIVAFRASFIS
jgi:hypothetical protein